MSSERSASLRFFMKAQSGIRTLYFTGLQTCAHPIYRPADHGSIQPAVRTGQLDRTVVSRAVAERTALSQADADDVARSEERRVGGGCSARWCPTHMTYILSY